MTKRFLHLAKYLLSFLAILSFLISLIALPSFRPSHVALASDRSFIVALIGYKPIIVRLENNTAYAHFDGLDFQGGFVSSGDNFIFDLYAYTDNTTANLEFLYNPFQVMAPYRYALYKLENGTYKPVKSSQWHYAEIMKIKKEMSESKNFSSNSLQTVNWKEIFPDIYFLWNKTSSLSPHEANTLDEDHPIKEYSQIWDIALLNESFESFINCGGSRGETRYFKYPYALQAVRFYPMSTTYSGARKAGFIMYTRGDDFVKVARKYMSPKCLNILGNTVPTISAKVENLDLKYWISKYKNGKSYEHYNLFTTGSFDSTTFFNPSQDTSKVTIAPAIGVIAALISPVRGDLGGIVGIVGALTGAIETYFGQGNVSFSFENNVLHLQSKNGFFNLFSMPIPVIIPDEETQYRWNDITYGIPQEHPEYPFAPFYISMIDDNPTQYIEKSVMNIQGSMWVKLFVKFEDNEHFTKDIFTFKFPIYITLRYRLVK